MPDPPNLYHHGILAYVVLSLSHLTAQFVLAQLNWFKQRAAAARQKERVDRLVSDGTLPPVSVIYPIYNETPEILEKVLRQAVTCLEIPKLELIFVDDGSPNLAELKPVYEKFSGDRVKVLYKPNGGKRDAQYAGFNVAQGEYFITVDSDTLINADGICRLIAPLLMDERIGGATGEIQLENRQETWLTRLQSLRYWLSFNLERAAQTYSGCMLCCAGPFSVYRREVIERVKDAYINQRFLGAKCTYGDDRHLTNLIIGAGYKTIFQQGAVAHTYAPTTLKDYIAQQTRWNKSFYRELFWTLGIFRQVSVYSMWDLLVQTTLFAGFICASGFTLFNLLNTFDLKVAVYYVALMVCMASTRSVYGLVRTLNPAFIGFIGYGLLHVLVLVPVRFKAILTLTDNHWGTRGPRRLNAWADFAKWFLAYVCCLIGLAGFIVLTTSETQVIANLQTPTFIFTGSWAELVRGASASYSRAFLPWLLTSSAIIGITLLLNTRKRVLSVIPGPIEDRPTSTPVEANRQPVR